jgi:hypothetical protein
MSSEREGLRKMTHYPITVWVGHSCPTPLTLALISADSLECAAKAEKIKGAGQACPEHDAFRLDHGTPPSEVLIKFLNCAVDPLLQG